MGGKARVIVVLIREKKGSRGRVGRYWRGGGLDTWLARSFVKLAANYGHLDQNYRLPQKPHGVAKKAYPEREPPLQQK